MVPEPLPLPLPLPPPQAAVVPRSTKPVTKAAPRFERVKIVMRVSFLLIIVIKVILVSILP